MIQPNRALVRPPVPDPSLAPGTCRVLIVGCSCAATAGLAEHLRQEDRFQITMEPQLAAALDFCRNARVDFLLADMTGRQVEALEFCRAFRALSRDHYGYLMLLTAEWSAESAAEALHAGADDCVPLPLPRDQLLARLGAGERVLRMEERLISTNRRLHGALAELRRLYSAMEGDLREARKLQLGLVPRRHVRVGGFELSLLLRPAGHIGGDLVGYRLIAPGRLAFYAIDVAGHGVTAALMTARLFAWLGGSDLLMAAESGGPAAIVGALNDLMLTEISADTYFTMVFGEVDPATGRVRLVQAGHPHPVLQCADGTMRQIGTGGMPVGVMERVGYEEVELTLGPGDRIFIASDGITEARAPAGMLLGDEGLMAVLQTNRQLRGPILLESLSWSVSEFSGGERSDDISALVIERDGTPAP